MTTAKIQSLMEQLTREVNCSDIDSKTLEKFRQFEVAIEPYLDDERADPHNKSVIDIAQELEVMFAVKHSTAEGIARQLVNTLVGLGI